MSEIQVASRYAKSLIDLAEEQNALDAIKDDITSFVAVLRSNTQLQAILKNPIIGPDKKQAILGELFSKSFHQVVMAFFNIVVSKGRSEILYATAKEFLQEYNRRKGIIKATVTSASPLTDESWNELVQIVTEATGKEVVLENTVNQDLIGGFVLKVGDRQFDASIASSLAKLKKEFKQKTF